MPLGCKRRTKASDHAGWRRKLLCQQYRLGVATRRRCHKTSPPSVACSGPSSTLLALDAPDPSDRQAQAGAGGKPGGPAPDPAEPVAAGRPEEPAVQAEPAEPPQAGRRFAEALGVILSRMASWAPAPLSPSCSSCFDSVRIPLVSICAYLDRIQQYFMCSDECFVLALVFVDRATTNYPTIRVSHRSCHRLLVTAVVLAAKFHDDTFYSNSYYAKVAGMDAQELYRLEVQLLKALDWNLNVQPHDYRSYHGLVSRSLWDGLLS